jgi:hypothetical protein
MNTNQTNMGATSEGAGCKSIRPNHQQQPMMMHLSRNPTFPKLNRTNCYTLWLYKTTIRYWGEETVIAWRCRIGGIDIPDSYGPTPLAAVLNWRKDHNNSDTYFLIRFETNENPGPTPCSTQHGTEKIFRAAYNRCKALVR